MCACVWGHVCGESGRVLLRVCGCVCVYSYVCLGACVYVVA